MDCSTSVLYRLLKFAQMHICWVGNAIFCILCHPLLLLPSIFPSHQGHFPVNQLFISDVKTHWSFSFSISPSSEYSGLISFRIDWCNLLAVQGTVKGLLQHNSKASILWHSDFFMVQLPHWYMTTRKTIALTIWTFVGKVMYMLFNTMPSFVMLSFQEASIF